MNSISKMLLLAVLLFAANTALGQQIPLQQSFRVDAGIPIDTRDTIVNLQDTILISNKYPGLLTYALDVGQWRFWNGSTWELLDGSGVVVTDPFIPVDTSSLLIYVPSHGITIPAEGYVPLNRLYQPAKTVSPDSSHIVYAVGVPHPDTIEIKFTGEISVVHGLTPGDLMYLQDDGSELANTPDSQVPAPTAFVIDSSRLFLSEVGVDLSQLIGRQVIVSPAITLMGGDPVVPTDTVIQMVISQLYEPVGKAKPGTVFYTAYASQNNNPAYRPNSAANDPLTPSIAWLWDGEKATRIHETPRAFSLTETRYGALDAFVLNPVTMGPGGVPNDSTVALWLQTNIENNDLRVPDGTMLYYVGTGTVQSPQFQWLVLGADPTNSSGQSIYLKMIKNVSGGSQGGSGGIFDASNDGDTVKALTVLIPDGSVFTLEFPYTSQGVFPRHTLFGGSLFGYDRHEDIIYSYDDGHHAGIEFYEPVEDVMGGLLLGRQGQTVLFSSGDQWLSTRTGRVYFYDADQAPGTETWHGLYMGNYNLPYGSPDEFGLPSGRYVLAYDDTGEGLSQELEDSPWVKIDELGLPKSVLFVSQSAGFDVSEATGGWDAPFENPWDAVDAANAGELVYVLDGIWYYGDPANGAVDRNQDGSAGPNKLLKEGVTVYFVEDTEIDVTRYSTQSPSNRNEALLAVEIGSNYDGIYRLLGALTITCGGPNVDIGFPMYSEELELEFDAIDNDVTLFGGGLANFAVENEEFPRHSYFKLKVRSGDVKITGALGEEFTAYLYIDESAEILTEGDLILKDIRTIVRNRGDINTGNFSVVLDNAILSGGSESRNSFFVKTKNIMPEDGSNGAVDGGMTVTLDGSPSEVLDKNPLYFGNLSDIEIIFRHWLFNDKGFYKFSFPSLPFNIDFTFDNVRFATSNPDIGLSDSSFINLEFFPESVPLLNDDSGEVIATLRATDTLVRRTNVFTLSGEVFFEYADTTGRSVRFLDIQGPSGFRFTDAMNDWITFRDFHFYSSKTSGAGNFSLINLDIDGQTEVRVINSTSNLTAATTYPGKTGTILYKGVPWINPY